MYIVGENCYNHGIIEKVYLFLNAVVVKEGVLLSTKEDKTKYDMEYAKAKLKRIPLDVQKEKYEDIKAAAEAAGETVNGYIKKAIDERMERDNTDKS